jgi:hypothetical protein
MKKLPFILFGVMVLTCTSGLFAQVTNNYEKLNTRIDNLGYWKAAAERGLTVPNPMIGIAPATYTGDEIRAVSVISENSPDVPTVTGATSQSENSIVVDPSNNNTVLNSNNSTNTPSGGITLYGADDLYSFDGGDTWQGEIAGAGGTNQGDPVALIGNDGRWFIGYIRNNGQWISYSDDQGDNWTAVNVANAPSGGGNLLDKNHMWIDRSNSSPYEGYLYDAWTTFGGSNNNDIEVSVSSDNGQTWSPGFNVSNSLNAGSHCQGVNITTGPNGEVYLLFAVYDNWPSDEDALALAKSTDGGQTWESTRIFNNIRGIRTSGTGKNMRVNSFPSITCDISTGPNRGNLYAVWANIGVPGTNTGNDIDVYMIRSEDQGVTWSDPIRVNQDPSGLGKEHYFPWIDCDPVSGTLSTVFYDDRNVGGAQCEVFCANSYDAGETWEDFKVSDVSFTPSPIPGLASSYFGDYLGIRAYGGNVYPVWTDNRTGTALTYVSPYTTSTMVAPTNLIATLNEEDGGVNLTWQHPLGPTFDHFNIYRNFALVGTAYFPTFNDTLPDYGHYRYIVTAFYSIEGESGGVIADVQWGNAQATIDPASVEETLLPGSTSTRYLEIANDGQLPLEYDLNFTLPAAKTGESRAYCSATGGCGEYITRVKIGDIDNASECGEYEDYTALSTILVSGMQYNLQITNGVNIYPSDLCGVWIDWNQNTNFSDDTPVTLQGTPGVGPYTATITVPENALSGDTRMRVRIIRNGALSSCGLTQYGEVEDYSLTVVNWISADPVSGTVNPGETGQVALNFNAGTLPLGDYHIDLNIESNDPDGLIVVPVTMTIQDIALAVTTDKDSICLGASTRLYANITGGSGNQTYLWTSDPAGFTSTEQNPLVFPEQTTAYFVEVTDGTIVLNDQITITTIELPEIELGPDVSECPGTPATLDAGPGFASYFWSNGSSEQTITVSEIGAYWVEVLNDFGCGSRDTVYFSYYPTPTVSLGEDASFCEGTSYTITAGEGFTAYSWSSGETTQEISVSQAGTYWVEITDANGCTASDTVVLTIDPLPGTTAIISGPTTIDNFQVTSSQFTASEATNATSYEWYIEPPTAGTISGTSLTGTVTWQAGYSSGWAQVRVMALNGCGHGVPAEFYQVTLYSSQGLAEQAGISGLMIYPNPSDGTFILEMTLKAEKELVFKVLNTTGKMIMQEKETAGQGRFTKIFDLTSLPKGSYRIAVVEASSGNLIDVKTAILN